MWKDYAIGSIKNNKATSISIASASFIASTLLSLLCCIFYNLWADDMQNGYTNATLSGAIYTVILLLAAVTLVLVIHNAFAVSMNAKMHQLGLMQSAGATPQQIRGALLYEAILLSAPPAISGTALGTGLSYLFMQYMINLSHDLVLPLRNSEIVFRLHPLVIVVALAIVLITVYVSAWIPARRLSKISPLEAIRMGDGQMVKKVRRFRLFSRLFGVEGELARKSLYARRRAFRMSSISLLLAVLAFSLFLNTDTISALSRQRTYFDKLQTEERIEALENDRKIREVYQTVMGGLCGLVAVIGMANVFSNALGGVAQRRREFARYASVGMTPAGIRKILAMEALLVSLKPMLVSALLNMLYVTWGLTRASVLFVDYVRNMPLAPIASFALLIVLLVGLAYFIGERRIAGQNTVKALRDDVLL